MEEEARKRKDRLEALRKRRLASNSDQKSVVFTNYTPNDENLQKNAELVTSEDIGNTVELETENIPKETLAKAEVEEAKDVDLTNLAPKKPNWDLRRDVEKKLDKLERRTQRAILEIIRDRLSDSDNLAEAVADAEKQRKLDAEIENE